MSVTVDSSSFDKGIKRFDMAVKKATQSGCEAVGGEILRLSAFEVPHDTGMLQNTGVVEPDREGAIVGYNKIYAARLHEHPEYNFQKGRKGKYLEDPIKHNLSTFRSFLSDHIASEVGI